MSGFCPVCARSPVLGEIGRAARGVLTIMPRNYDPCRCKPAPRETQPTPHRRLTLASGSPRRAALMREHGFDVSIIEPPLAEPTDLNAAATPYERARALSFFKAQSVAEVVADGWIIAGDTVAALNGVVFGKPVDRADAHRILATIGGTTHEVITGVTLLDAQTGARLIEHDVTLVTMKKLGEKAIESYLDTGAWEGKAGAYGIQDHGDAFVTKTEGSFSNVVGFPMELIARMLTQWDTATRRTI